MFLPETLDLLEDYLQEARIIGEYAFAQHGAHQSYILMLEGGVTVLAKPADEIGDGNLMVRHERAAWVLLRALGWAEMMGATILRRIRSFKSGIEVDASLQIIWPFNQPDATPNVFSDDDIWRGAIFDAAVGHTDRGGHNWLAVPQPGLAAWSGLKLIDHGHAFPDSDQPPNSDFYRLKAGQPIPGNLTPALTALAANPPDLGSEVGQAASDALMRRVRQMSNSGVLQLP